MKITICASMMFAEQQLEAKRILEEQGHTVLVSEFVDAYVGKDEKKKKRSLCIIRTRKMP